MTGISYPVLWSCIGKMLFFFFFFKVYLWNWTLQWNSRTSGNIRQVGGALYNLPEEEGYDRQIQVSQKPLLHLVQISCHCLLVYIWKHGIGWRKIPVFCNGVHFYLSGYSKTHLQSTSLDLLHIWNKISFIPCSFKGNC